MKQLIFAVILFWTGVFLAEEPDALLAGCALKDGVLTCGTIGVSFPLPEQWFVAPEAPRPTKLAEGAYQLLVADKHVGLMVRNRMIIIADNYAGNSSHHSVQKYVSGMVQNFIKQQNGELLKDTEATKLGGVEFYRADCKTSEEGVGLFKSVVATEANGYYLTWIFVSGSTEQLNDSIQSLERLAITKIVGVAEGVGASASSSSTGALYGIIQATPTGAKPLRIRVSQGVSEKMLIHKVQPIYPSLARENRIEGLVVLKALIGTDGTIKELSLVSGDPLLAESALSAVRQWRYKPYFLNGSPVAVDTLITVNYVLGLNKNSQPASPTGN